MKKGKKKQKLEDKRGPRGVVKKKQKNMNEGQPFFKLSPGCFQVYSDGREKKQKS